MLTLINTNRMTPPIAPIGLDYIASALRASKLDVELVDLCLATDPEAELAAYFRSRQPELVGLTFRNVEDCFWPSARSFLPVLERDVAAVRAATDAPIVLGGVGYSLFAAQILERSQADFGIRGDGEESLAVLMAELRGDRNWSRVPGLVYREGAVIRTNPPAWPPSVPWVSRRDFVANGVYFQRGGQLGVEGKRGCPRRCIYCADPVAKGTTHRLRDPAVVAEEMDVLVHQGVDVIHFCDPEFNLPPQHAQQVCEELIRRNLGDRMRWYAYLAVVPLSDRLVRLMRAAGCVGINFTSDAAHPAMLAAYRQPHRAEDLAQAVTLCRRHGITVMFDMLLGGPGETPETLAETIAVFQRLDPDCAGAALGIRVYPDTPLFAQVLAEGPAEDNPNLRRGSSGPVDWLEPTFYVSSALGPEPARRVRELIGDDARFFPPQLETSSAAPAAADDHNYSDNRTLTEALAAGQRGAYWDILRRARVGR